MQAKELAEAVGGTLVCGTDGTIVNGIVTDSRGDCSGMFFLPVAGERFDGHEFVETAVANGADGYFWAREKQPPKTESAAVIRVADTLAAYQAAARANRKRCKAIVIGLTGSSGKTSTKALVANVLSKRKTISTYENENNEIGAPKTLLRIDGDTEYAVVEMAMRARGEIAQLASAALPDHGLITNVGQAHIGLLGTEENIARAKGEMLEYVDPSGKVFLNADNRWTPMLREMSPAEVVTFGMESGDVRSADVSYGLDGVSFRVIAGEAEFALNVASPGKAGVYNALSAAAVGLALGLGGEEISEGMSLPVVEGGRMRRLAASDGRVVLDDSYNANPDSVRFALDMLKRVDWKGRKVAVLGDMLELGESAGEEHYRLGLDSAGECVDVLVTMGDEAARIAEGALESGEIRKEKVFSFGSFENLAAEKEKIFEAGDLVLVKGSRGMKMERIVKLIEEM